MSKKISLSSEIIRFVITGLICSILDLLVSQLFIFILKNSNETLITIVSTAMGFLIGVIANYILSTFWVFKGGKNESKTKTPTFIVLFVLLSIGALLLSVGTMELLRIIVFKVWNINIVEHGFETILNFTFYKDQIFWVYFLCFCIKTLIGLIWNYLTRKFILYKTDNKVEINEEEVETEE